MARRERVFNFRRKPYRPRYSWGEFQAALAILILLGAIALWVSWKGRHPEPKLFSPAPATLKVGGIEVYERPLVRWTEGAGKPSQAGSTRSPSASPLSPFPETLLSPPWKELGRVQTFDETNLYNKIDGREGFYKSFGFRYLYTLSLVHTEDPGTTIDIELFDLGKIENALGAMIAEMPDPGTKLETTESGLIRLTRNAAFFTQGPYYGRIIGADDREPTRRKIATIVRALVEDLPGEPMPWPYRRFLGAFDTTPGRIHYLKENAFSFAFLDHVYTAGLTGRDTEVFASRRSNEGEARILMERLAEALSTFGRRMEAEDSKGRRILLVENEYLHTLDAITTEGPFLIGVRFAEARKGALALLKRLGETLREELEGSKGGEAPPASVP